MPRKSVLANNEIYHVFNRSVGREELFKTKRNLNRFVELIDYYRFPQTLRYAKYKTLPKDQKSNYLTMSKETEPLIQLFAYAFMPNHYHIILKQLQDDGISHFISIVQNSFAKYYNFKSDRHGSLFQNSFKAVRIENDEVFLHISRYIHLNPVTSFIIKKEKLDTYPWTSFPQYVKDHVLEFVNTEPIMAFFSTKLKYRDFVYDQADYQQSLGEIKNAIFE